MYTPGAIWRLHGTNIYPPAAGSEWQIRLRDLLLIDYAAMCKCSLLLLSAAGMYT